MKARDIPFSAWVGLAGIALALACALFAPLVAPYGETEIVGGVWEPMGGAFPLGTDNLGRDLLSRLVYGARTTISVALAATLLSFALGIVLSFTAAVRGGVTDQALSRLNDLMMAIPTLIFALVTLLGILIGEGVGLRVDGSALCDDASQQIRLVGRAGRRHSRFRRNYCAHGAPRYRRTSDSAGGESIERAKREDMGVCLPRGDSPLPEWRARGSHGLWKGAQ